ncbi:MAG: 3-keto-disaccharide hydrolase [Planctomycetota bacterium]|jgi:hypothetical protein
MHHRASLLSLLLAVLAGAVAVIAPSDESGDLRRAFIDGADWTPLGLSDFVNVNGTDDTWSESDGVIRCSGIPLGGARTTKQYENFELVLEWRHLVEAGNSGVFLWCPESAFTDLPPGKLPRSGIEVQVLDLDYETRHRDPANIWFTSHGDVFPVGASNMKPFEPAAPNGRRSFPSKQLTKGVGEWNHYYIRAINGEVRLWVNGEEVSGGTDCKPASGYLALESEGSAVEFRNLRIRELP